jgi:hypothetical protein
MNEPEISSLPSSKAPDDFLKIKGIGQSIAQALIELNITRYEQIASLTPEQLAGLLHPRLTNVTAQRIAKDDWPGQARSLQGSRTPGQKSPDADPDSSDSRQTLSQMAHDGWRELADFFVSFGNVTGEETGLKTRVHYSQGDQYMEWDGIAASNLLDWMINQAGLAPQLKLEQTPSESPDRKIDPVLPGSNNQEGHITITNIWVSEVQIPSNAERGEVSHRVQIEADIQFNETGSQVEGASPVEMSVDIYLVNVVTGDSLFYETPPTSIRRANEAVQFKFDFEIPPPGSYQLYIMGRLLPDRRGSSLLPGPILRVVS